MANHLLNKSEYIAVQQFVLLRGCPLQNIFVTTLPLHQQ